MHYPQIYDYQSQNHHQQTGAAMMSNRSNQSQLSGGYMYGQSQVQTARHSYNTHAVPSSTMRSAPIVPRYSSNRHPNGKNRMCPYFLKGKCFFPDSCNFAHNISELRPDLNQALIEAGFDNPDALYQGMSNQYPRQNYQNQYQYQSGQHSQSRQRLSYAQGHSQVYTQQQQHPQMYSRVDTKYRHSDYSTHVPEHFVSPSVRVSVASQMSPDSHNVVYDQEQYVALKSSDAELELSDEQVSHMLNFLQDACDMAEQ